MRSSATSSFPCHNCAKHIVAAGIERLVHVEDDRRNDKGPFIHASPVYGPPLQKLRRRPVGRFEAHAGRPFASEAEFAAGGACLRSTACPCRHTLCGRGWGSGGGVAVGGTVA